MGNPVIEITQCMDPDTSYPCTRPNETLELQLKIEDPLTRENEAAGEANGAMGKEAVKLIEDNKKLKPANGELEMNNEKLKVESEGLKKENESVSTHNAPLLYTYCSSPPTRRSSVTQALLARPKSDATVRLLMSPNLNRNFQWKARSCPSIRAWGDKVTSAAKGY